MSLVQVRALLAAGGNEPNHPQFLGPQWVRGKPYADMLRQLGRQGMQGAVTDAGGRKVEVVDTSKILSIGGDITGFSTHCASILISSPWMQPASSRRRP